MFITKTIEELKEINDVELLNYFVNKAVPNTRSLTEEEHCYREEILRRMQEYRFSAELSYEVEDPYENCNCEICRPL